MKITARLSATLAVLVFFSVLRPMLAEDTAISDELKKLAAEVELLKLRAAIADSQATIAKDRATIADSQATVAKDEAAIVASKFPTNKVTPLNGDLTVKDYDFPPQLLAYTASEQMVPKVVSKIARILESRGKTHPRIVIYTWSVLHCLPNAQLTNSYLLAHSAISTALGECDEKFRPLRIRLRNLVHAKVAASDYIKKAKALLTPPPSPMPASLRFFLLKRIWHGNARA